MGERSESSLGRSTRKLLQASRLIAREQFEFDLHLISVTNWQTFGALRRFAVRWQRGKARLGVALWTTQLLG